jgi:hypothetical protein
MAPPIGSSRHKKHVLALIKQKFQDNPYKPLQSVTDLYNDYMDSHVPEDTKERFHKEIVDYMVDTLKEIYEDGLRYKNFTLQQVDRMIFRQPIEDVRYFLWSMVEIWAITYKPVAELKDIVEDEQSVHTIVVLKATNEGIGILVSVSVPPGQKTLAEIGAAWLKLSRQDLRLDKESYVVPRIKYIIDDMNDWGKRPTVMHKTENLYRKTLRGLWAKIKTFEASTYTELVKRLWEECSEARGLCADGHVGRLVNVLVGFDEEFKSNISPKEYFQNNMSLIANSTAPLTFKIEQATKLMDDAGMAEEERAVWLEAFS